MFKAVILFAVVALAIAEKKREIPSEGIWNGAGAYPGYSGLVDPTVGSIYGAGLGYKSGLSSLYHPSSVYSGLGGVAGYPGYAGLESPIAPGYAGLESPIARGYAGLESPIARGYGIPSTYGHELLSSRFGGVARSLGSFPAYESPLAASHVYQPYTAQYGYSAGAYPTYKK